MFIIYSGTKKLITSVLKGKLSKVPEIENRTQYFLEMDFLAGVGIYYEDFRG